MRFKIEPAISKGRFISQGFTIVDTENNKTVKTGKNKEPIFFYKYLFAQNWLAENITALESKKLKIFSSLGS